MSKSYGHITQSMASACFIILGGGFILAYSYHDAGLWGVVKEFLSLGVAVVFYITLTLIIESFPKK